MADTIREKIIKALLTRLAAWKTASGYSANCGQAVYRATRHLDLAALPACVLWPMPETCEARYGKNLCTMMVKIEAVVPVPDGSSASVIGEALLGDAIKIMTDPAVTITALTDTIAYTSGGADGGQNPEHKVAGVAAEFTIQYQTQIGNPYQ